MYPPQKPPKHFKGFTLAELLIALLILGVIATFTVPKILVASQNQRYNAIGKETAATIAGAYQQAQAEGIVSSSMTPGDLTPYLNYVRVDTSTTIDHLTGNSSSNCSPTAPCYVLHNGAFLAPIIYASFGGTSNINYIGFRMDPDGVYSGTTNGPGKAIGFNLFYDGFITSFGQKAPRPGCVNSYFGANFCNSLGPDPDWFNWSQ